MNSIYLILIILVLILTIRHMVVVWRASIIALLALLMGSAIILFCLFAPRTGSGRSVIFGVLLVSLSLPNIVKSKKLSDEKRKQHSELED